MVGIPGGQGEQRYVDSEQSGESSMCSTGVGGDFRQRHQGVLLEQPDLPRLGRSAATRSQQGTPPLLPLQDSILTASSAHPT